MKHRGFTGSVWTNHAQGLTFSDLKVELMQDFHLSVTCIQIFNFQKWITLNKSRYFFKADCFCQLLCLPIYIINGNDGFDSSIVISN